MKEIKRIVSYALAGTMLFSCNNNGKKEIEERSWWQRRLFRMCRLVHIQHRWGWPFTKGRNFLKSIIRGPLLASTDPGTDRKYQDIK